MMLILIIYLILSLIVAGYAWSVRNMGILSSLICGLMWPLTILMLVLGLIAYAIGGNKEKDRDKGKTYDR